MLIAFLILGIFKDGALVTTYAKSGKARITKKSITLYKGKSKKIKLKSFKKAKSVKIKNNGKSVVSVKRKAGAIVIKSKRLGRATVTVSYKVKKKKYQYKIKVKVKRGGANSSGSKGSSSTGTSSKTSKKKGKTKYSYDVRVISQGTIYNNVVIYVKTNNPDKSFHFENDDCILSSSIPRYDNIKYLDSEGRVPGGYLIQIFLDDSVENNLELYENKQGSFGIYTGIRIEIHLGDFAKAEDAYMDKMISKAKENIKEKKAKGYRGYDMFSKDSNGEMVIHGMTFDEMSENQLLLSELTCMIQEEYIYLKVCNAGTSKERRVNLFGVDDRPSWESKCINCLESTRIMRAFATKLGLKSENTYAGYLDHHYATVTIDGKAWIFDACPYDETGRIEDGSWKMVDVRSMPNNSNVEIIKN